MKKMQRMPHEQVSPDENDGLPASGDVEGHRARSGPGFLPGMPGTGGDQIKRHVTADDADANLHRQVGGEDDVEGHLGHTKGERFLPGLPGTGGDKIKRPVTGDEGSDDVEGHSFGHTKGERFLPGLPGTGGDEADVKRS